MPRTAALHFHRIISRPLPRARNVFQFFVEDFVSTQSTDSAEKTSSKNLKRHIAQYSLAAAAAGVSMLAVAQPVQSEVVVTRKTLSLSPFGAATNIDLNDDGITDFTFYNYSSFGSQDLFVEDAGGGVVGPGYASALMRGAKIGPFAKFGPASSNLTGIERGFGVGYGNSHFSGNWKDAPKNRYLGVRFKIQGETHYGWIRLAVVAGRGQFGINATITGYAYETVPNKPILAGTAETSTAEVQENIQSLAGPSLGLLAAGVDGVALWRREETLTSK